MVQIKKPLLNKKESNKKTNVFNLSLYLLSLCILMLGFSYASVPLYQLYCQVTGLGGIAQEANQYEMKGSQDISKSSFKFGVDKNDEEKQYNSSNEKNKLVNGSSDIIISDKSLSFGTEHPSSEKNILWNAGVDQSQGMNKLEEKISGNERKALTIHFNSETSENMPWSFKPTIQKMKVYPGDTALTFYIAENKTEEAVSGISTYNITPQKAGVYFNKIQCFCFEEQRLKPHESIEMPILFFIDSEFLDDPKMKDVSTITLSYTFYRCS